MIKFATSLQLINKKYAISIFSNKYLFAKGQQKDTSQDNQSKKGRQPDNRVKIDPKYLYKSAALYDKYKQQRQKPLLTLDNYQIKYSWILERVPIFYPYQSQYFTYYKNRLNLGKKAGYSLSLPKQLIIQEGDYLFKEYERVNPENIPSHEVVINGQTKYYRENSRYWRYTDPQIIDQKSVQTNSSDNVFFIVKTNQGNWEFPSRIFLQKQSHQQFFKSFSHDLFAGEAYPNIYFPTKKPTYCIKQQKQDLQRGAGLKTFFFCGYSMSGIPVFPTTLFSEYKWVPKASLTKYFSDQYFDKVIPLAHHSF